jgi:hypothetical protein
MEVTVHCSAEVGISYGRDFNIAKFRHDTGFHRKVRIHYINNKKANREQNFSFFCKGPGKTEEALFYAHLLQM